MKLNIAFNVNQNTDNDGYWQFDILPTLTICRMYTSYKANTYYAFIGWLLWDAAMRIDVAKGGRR